MTQRQQRAADSNGRASRTARVAEQIQHVVAEFVASESNRTSLVTITHATVSPDLKQATVFFTVLPDEKEEEVLFFLKRNGSDIRKQLSKKSNLKRLPFLEFKIDTGEKHRQRIDELIYEDKQ